MQLTSAQRPTWMRRAPPQQSQQQRTQLQQQQQQAVPRQMARRQASLLLQQQGVLRRPAAAQRRRRRTPYQAAAATRQWQRRRMQRRCGAGWRRRWHAETLKYSELSTLHWPRTRCLPRMDLLLQPQGGLLRRRQHCNAAALRQRRDGKWSVGGLLARSLSAVSSTRPAYSRQTAGPGSADFVRGMSVAGTCGGIKNAGGRSVAAGGVQRAGRRRGSTPQEQAGVGDGSRQGSCDVV